METHLDVISRLNADLDRILMPFISTEPFSLLDFPDYPNVGDSAIWLGEVSYFAKHNVIPSYVSRRTYVDWRSLAKRTGLEGTIFLSGGGNFGDLWCDDWPNCQAFREAVITEFPNRKIVQLPQTIFYRSQRNADRTARVIEAHNDFTLLVRDHPSFDFASQRFQCKVLMCPDMALALGPLHRRASVNKDVLLLLRSDKESAGCLAESRNKPWQGADTADWIRDRPLTSAHAKMNTLFVHGAQFLRQQVKREDLVLRYYNQIAEARLNRGLRLLSRYRRVVSDRLHGHILSTLLGIPHVVIDNNYGKIRSFVDAWSTQWDGVRQGRDVWEEVVRSAQELGSERR